MSNDDPHGNSLYMPSVQINQMTQEQINQQEQRRKKKFEAFKSGVIANGDPNTKLGAKQVTALHFAIRRLDMVKYLVETYPDLEIDPQDIGGMTPIMQALMCVKMTIPGRVENDENVEIVKYLIDHGANIHLVTGSGCTYLHMAVLQYNLEMVKYFLDKGIDKNKLWHGKTAAETLKNDIGICKEIIEYINAYEPLPTKGVNGVPDDELNKN